MTQRNFFGFIQIENVFNFLAVLSLVISPFQRLEREKQSPEPVTNA